MLVTLLMVLGGFEAGMVFAVRPSFRAGKLGPTQAFGILSSIFISGALLPQYWEIYKHGEVIGISITFMLVDCLGGVFSDLSLAFKPTFDVIAGVAYTLVVVLDGIVIILALFLNPRAKRRRELEAAAAAAATSDADNHNLREPSSGEESGTPEDTASAIVTMTEEGPHPPPSLAVTPRTRSRLSSSGARSMEPTAYTPSTPFSDEEKRTLQPDVKEVERGSGDFPPSPV
ncbi:hypothetical protein NLI96_g765 [Meripilus lineatus]|uniref:Uncharacterized protein n=1 Tax=Meripilus lineatus TaxID=2056292 RepID=A0AAD5VD70_9APHY|nr:hypothetical protein NLI96_g765 [Physisporinus lineatus]